jgi:hypothetical protein
MVDIEMLTILTESRVAGLEKRADRRRKEVLERMLSSEGTLV